MLTYRANVTDKARLKKDFDALRCGSREAAEKRDGKQIV
jgi:hypothetical protein